MRGTIDIPLRELSVLPDIALCDQAHCLDQTVPLTGCESWDIACICDYGELTPPSAVCLERNCTVIEALGELFSSPLLSTAEPLILRARDEASERPDMRRSRPLEARKYSPGLLDSLGPFGNSNHCALHLAIRYA